MAAQVISTKHSVLATHSVMPVYFAGTRRTRAINGRPMARSSNSAPAAPSHGLTANPTAQIAMC